MPSVHTGAVQKEQKQVEEELGILYSRVEELARNTEKLEMELESVLRPRADGQVGDAITDQPLVPLAEEIRGSRRCVEDVDEGVLSMLKRLEL